MTLLPKVLSCLAIAAFLLAGALTGHYGHSQGGGSPLPGHDAQMAVASPADGPGNGAGDQGDLDKAGCDFAQVSSCGMGHCCLVAPTVALARLKDNHSFSPADFADLEHRQDWLELPPPKRS